jgi:hypothetical protein
MYRKYGCGSLRRCALHQRIEEVRLEDCIIVAPVDQAAHVPIKRQYTVGHRRTGYVLNIIDLGGLLVGVLVPGNRQPDGVESVRLGGLDHRLGDQGISPGGFSAARLHGVANIKTQTNLASELDSGASHAARKALLSRLH